MPDSWTYNPSTGVWTSSSGQTAYGQNASTGEMVGVGYKGGAVPVSIYAPVGGISPQNTLGAGSSGYIPKTGPGTTGMVESSPIRSSSDRFQPKPDRTPFTPAKDDKAVNVEGIGTLNKSEVVMAAKDYMSNSMYGMGYASLDPARRGTLETAYARSFLQKNIERDTADGTISKNEWLYGFVSSGSNRLAGTAKAGGAMNAGLQGKPTIEVINELSRVGNALVDEYKALDAQIKAYNPGYDTTGAMAYPTWLNEKIVEYQAKVDAYNAMKNKYSSEINKYNATISDVSGAARASQIYKGGIVEKKSGFYTMGELPVDFQDISSEAFSDALTGYFAFKSGEKTVVASASTPIANIQEIIHGSGLDQFTQESIERGISIGTSNMYELSNQSSNVPFPPYEPEPGESSIQNKRLLLRMEDVYPSLAKGKDLGFSYGIVEVVQARQQQQFLENVFKFTGNQGLELPIMGIAQSPERGLGTIPFTVFPSGQVIIGQASNPIPSVIPKLPIVNVPFNSNLSSGTATLQSPYASPGQMPGVAFLDIGTGSSPKERSFMPNLLAIAPINQLYQIAPGAVEYPEWGLRVGVGVKDWTIQSGTNIGRYVLLLDFDFQEFNSAFKFNPNYVSESKTGGITTPLLSIDVQKVAPAVSWLVAVPGSFIFPEMAVVGGLTVLFEKAIGVYTAGESTVLTGLDVQRFGAGSLSAGIGLEIFKGLRQTALTIGGIEIMNPTKASTFMPSPTGFSLWNPSQLIAENTFFGAMTRMAPKVASAAFTGQVYMGFRDIQQGKAPTAEGAFLGYGTGVALGLFFEGGAELYQAGALGKFGTKIQNLALWSESARPKIALVDTGSEVIGVVYKAPARGFARDISGEFNVLLKQSERPDVLYGAKFNMPKLSPEFENVGLKQVSAGNTIPSWEIPAIPKPKVIAQELVDIKALNFGYQLDVNLDLLVDIKARNFGYQLDVNLGFGYQLDVNLDFGYQLDVNLDFANIRPSSVMEVQGKPIFEFVSGKKVFAEARTSFGSGYAPFTPKSYIERKLVENKLESGYYFGKASEYGSIDEFGKEWGNVALGKYAEAQGNIVQQGYSLLKAAEFKTPKQLKISLDELLENVKLLKYANPKGEAINLAPAIKQVLLEDLAMGRSRFGIFGGASSNAQLGYSLNTADIDLYSYGIEPKGPEFLASIKKAYPKEVSSGRIRVNPENPNLLERFVVEEGKKGAYAHILDIHSPFESTQEVDAVGSILGGFEREAPVWITGKYQGKPFKFGISSLREEEFGPASHFQAITGIRASDNVKQKPGEYKPTRLKGQMWEMGPEPHRLKDVPRTFQIAEGLGFGSKAYESPLTKFQDAYIAAGYPAESMTSFSPKIKIPSISREEALSKRTLDIFAEQKYGQIPMLFEGTPLRVANRIGALDMPPSGSAKGTAKVLAKAVESKPLEMVLFARGGQSEFEMPSKMSSKVPSIKFVSSPSEASVGGSWAMQLSFSGSFSRISPGKSYLSVSPSPSPSISPSIFPSPSISPSRSASPSRVSYPSPSPSTPRYPSLSPSISMSISFGSVSTSISPSPSPSISISPSISPSLSPLTPSYPSPSPSYSPSPSPSPPYSRIFFPGFDIPDFESNRDNRRKVKMVDIGRIKTRSLAGVLSGARFKKMRIYTGLESR